MTHVSDLVIEDTSRVDVATEDIDMDEFQGDIPNMVSPILDVNNISQSHDFLTLREIKEMKEDVIINVIYGSKILEHYQDDTYFTSSFPTIFPWGTAKHSDPR